MPGVSANGNKADPFARPAEGMRINRLHKGRPIAGFSCLVWSGRAAFAKKPSVFPALRGFPVKARGGETGCFPQHAGGTAYGPNGMSLAKREKAALDREASQGRTRVFGRDGRLGAGGVLTAGPRRSRFFFAALTFCEGLQVPFREGRK